MSAPASLFLLKDGQQSGPYSAADLQSMMESGNARAEDHVWGEGMTEWVALGSFLGQPHPDVHAVPTPDTEDAPDTHERGFGAALVDALAYPFRGDGFLILALGTLLFTVLGFVGMFSWIISAAAWGYLLLMLQQVLHGTAMGEDRVPNWPDFDGIGELLGKTVQWIGVLAACFAPAFLLGMTASEDDIRDVGSVVLFLVGLVVSPMALLSVGMHDTLQGLHPGLILRSIVRAPGHYLAMLLVFVALAFVQFLAGKLSDLLPIAGILIDKLDELWTAVFIARVLGAFYHVNRRRLSWFGE